VEVDTTTVLVKRHKFFLGTLKKPTSDPSEIRALDSMGNFRVSEALGFRDCRYRSVDSRHSEAHRALSKHYLGKLALRPTGG
jgi:hypothetical protein